MKHTPLSQESVRLRKVVRDGCWPDPADGHYLNADCFVGVCPVCGGPIGVRFAGRAPRAELTCHDGCSESAIAAAIGLQAAAQPPAADQTTVDQLFRLVRELDAAAQKLEWDALTTDDLALLWTTTSQLRDVANDLDRLPALRGAA